MDLLNFVTAIVTFFEEEGYRPNAQKKDGKSDNLPCKNAPVYRMTKKMGKECTS